MKNKDYVSIRLNGTKPFNIELNNIEDLWGVSDMLAMWAIEQEEHLIKNRKTDRKKFLKKKYPEIMDIAKNIISQ